MILIADSGSTKTSWSGINSDGKQMVFNTEGYNPFYVDAEYIMESLGKTVSEVLKQEEVSEVFFYGAGCMGDKTAIVKDAMQQIFTNARVNVHIDLLAAARSVLGNNSGFCAILGTGTNSCLYNGKEIIHNIDSLGFLLGDEGSGCSLGKKLLSDYARGYMPIEVSKAFQDKYEIQPDEVIDRLYSAPLANRFCGSFSKFINEENIKNDYLRNLVKDCFKDFFDNLVTHYPKYKEYTFNCVGSVGYTFKEILKEVSVEYNMKPGNIIKSPLQGLVKYHLEIAPVRTS